MRAFTRGGAWWVVVGMGAVAVGACDAVLGIQEYDARESQVGAEGGPGGKGGDAGEDGGRACGIAAGTAGCGACIQASCCGQAEACAGNSACAAYEDCLVPCGGDYACRARCMIADFANAGEIPQMDQCVAAQCSNECGLVCGTAGSYAEPDAAVGCQECLTANACSSAQQCGMDLDCEGIAQCATECATLDCFWGCGLTKDAGTLDFVAYTSASVPCVGPCGGGNYWDCPPSPQPPASEVGETTVSLNFIVMPNGDPLANATVKACELADTECTTPVVAPGTTDAQGTVTFVLPAISLVGFWGYFDISSPAIYPMLYFLQAPLSVPQVTLPGLTVPSASTVQGLYSSHASTPDPARGVIEILASDCHWFPAPNVTAQADLSDAGVSLAYFVNGMLSSTATATDGNGAAVLLNAPADLVSLSVTPPVPGHAPTVVTLFARPETLSFMFVHP